MKILYSCFSRSWGGLEMSTVRGVKQLLDRNFEAELICFPESRIHAEAILQGIKTHCFNVDGYFNPQQILKIRKFLSNSNFDIIHSHASQDLWALVLAIKLTSKNIPLLLTKRVGSFIVKKDPLHNFLYKNLTCAIAISAVIEKNLIETTALTSEKIKLIHNGIDLKKFNPLNVKGSVRQEFKIPNDKLVIGFIGRFTKGKGHEEFIEAAEILSKKYASLIFLITGEASRDEESYEAKIRNLVHQKELNDKLIFTGYRNDTPEVLSAMDIFVFPSHSEAFGNALVEAMAMEKPTVASNSDGVLDIAQDGITSFLFQNKESDDLAAKIEQLINDQEKRKDFGRAGRKRVIEKFDREKQMDKLIGLYKSYI